MLIPIEQLAIIILIRERTVLIIILGFTVAGLTALLIFISVRLFQATLIRHQDASRIQLLTAACADSLAQIDLAVLLLERQGTHPETQIMRRLAMHLKTILAASQPNDPAETSA